jgi:transposase-like protein
VREALEDVLEAEMEETLGAAKGERTAERQDYRSGYYSRSLIRRIGKIESRVPQHRQGRFHTEVFERYQRSEKALVSALAERYLEGRVYAQGQEDQRGVVRAQFFGERDFGGGGQAR